MAYCAKMREWIKFLAVSKNAKTMLPEALEEVFIQQLENASNIISWYGRTVIEQGMLPSWSIMDKVMMVLRGQVLGTAPPMMLKQKAAQGKDSTYLKNQTLNQRGHDFTMADTKLLQISYPLSNTHVKVCYAWGIYLQTLHKLVRHYSHLQRKLT